MGMLSQFASRFMSGGRRGTTGAAGAPMGHTGGAMGGAGGRSTDAAMGRVIRRIFSRR